LEFVASERQIAPYWDEYRLIQLIQLLFNWLLRQTY
jgi:hypothetical protein